MHFGFPISHKWTLHPHDAVQERLQKRTIHLDGEVGRIARIACHLSSAAQVRQADTLSMFPIGFLLDLSHILEQARPMAVWPNSGPPRSGVGKDSVEDAA